MAAERPPVEYELALQAKGGSVEAFGELVGIHHQSVFSFLLTLTRHRQDAEDLTQETFLRAWAKFRHYDPGQPLLPWLFTIGRRLSIAALRRKRPLPAEAFDPVEQPGSAALWLWEIAKSTLTPDAYSALWLHYREELPLKGVAAVMGKREGAIKVILHRARESLSEKLQGHSAGRSGGGLSAYQHLLS